MTRVTATEFKNNIGAFSDAAMREPVIITSHDRDRLVLLSAEEYSRLAGHGVSEDRKAMMRETDCNRVFSAMLKKSGPEKDLRMDCRAPHTNCRT